VCQGDDDLVVGVAGGQAQVQLRDLPVRQMLAAVPQQAADPAERVVGVAAVV
jgi:hypothetical protein